MLMKYLITADNCPKCEAVREYLDEHPVDDLQIFNASTEEGFKIASEHKVRSAPTLILFDSHEPSEVTYKTGSEIIEYFSE